MPIPHWIRRRLLLLWSQGRPRAARPRYRPQFDDLESRVLLSVIHWTNPAGGDWGVPANWDLGRLPGLTDDVVIDGATNFTVTHARGSDTVHSLTTGKALTLTGGTLAVTATVQSVNQAVLTLAGGTLAQATVTAATTITGTGAGGTLDQVTLNGTLTLAGAPNALAVVTGGLTLNGLVTLGDGSPTDAGVLRFVGAQTLAGTGTVQFGRGDNNTVWAAQNRLTIGRGVTLRGQVGYVGWNPNLGSTPDATFINQGTIQADVAGGTLTLLGSGWTSTGTLRAQNGATLTLAASSGKSWSNGGLIAAATGGTVLLGSSGANFGVGSSFALDAGSTFDTQGGTVYLGSTLANAGRTLALNGATTGSWRLRAGGVIDGGTVTTANGARLVATSSAGTLNAVTLNGDLDLTAANAALTVSNGLTLNGTATLGSDTTAAGLTFRGTQTLAGSGSVLLAGGGLNRLTTDNQSTLTLGAGIRVHGKGGTLGYVAGAGDDRYPSFNILGTVAADAPGGAITVNATGWTSGGNLQATAGGTLNLQGTWTNAGGITADSGGTLNLGDAGDAFTLAATTNLYTAGGTVNLSGTLNNAGKTFTLNAATTGSWRLVGGGQVLGGTVLAVGGARLIGTATGGSLSGVVLGADLDLGTFDGAQVTVQNGLTLGGTVSLGNAAGTTRGTLTFAGGPQTLAGAGTVVFGPNPLNELDTRGSLLTIGPSLTLRGHSGAIDGTFINQGVLAADRAGGTITLRGQGWSNPGTLMAQNGGTLSALYLPTNYAGGTLTGGTWQVFANSTLRLFGAYLTTDAAAVLLDGAGARIARDAGTADALDGLAAVAAGSSFTVQDGANFTAAGAFQNQGSLTVGAASTFRASLSNLSGGTLAGGVYVVQGTLRLNNPDDIHVNSAAVTLQGPAALIADAAGGNALATLESNTAQGRLNFLDGRSFTTSGAFTNAGSLTVGVGSSFFATSLSNYDALTKTLSGGTFVVGGTLRFTNADVLTNAATLVLDGPASQVLDQANQDALAHFTTNAGGGRFTVQNGRNLTTSGMFLNNGTLEVGQGSTFFARSLANFIAGHLIGGTFLVTGRLQFTGAAITANDANTILNGPSAAIVDETGADALTGFNLNDFVGTFTAQNGRPFTPRPDFRNLGAVAIGPGSTVTLSAGNQVGGVGALLVAPGATLLMAGSGGTSTIVNNLINQGTVIVQRGTTLNLAGGFFNFVAGTLIGGTYDLAGALQFKGADLVTNRADLVLDGPGSGIIDENGNNALVHFATNSAGGSLTLQNGRTLSPAGGFTNDGTLTIGAGSSLTVTGTYTHTGTLTVQDQGAFNLAGSGTLSAGTVAGAGPVTVNGRLTWTGGVMTGPGTTTVAAGARLDISGGGEKSLNGRTLSNNGTVTWSGTGSLDVGNGAGFLNQAGAVFDAQSDAGLVFTGGTPVAFRNAGTFRKSAGTGTTLVSAGLTFNNTGTLEVLAGTLNLSTAFQNFDGVTHTLTGGTYRLQGRLQFTGADISTNAASIILDGPNSAIINEVGTYALANLTQNAPAAGITVRNGRTLSLGALTNQGGLTLEAGGTLSLGNDLTSTGTVTWAGGRLTGPGTLEVAAGSTLAVTGSDDKYLDPGAGVRIEGSAGWTGTGVLWLSQGSGVTVAAGGTLDVQDGTGFRLSGSGEGTVTNQGTFRKSAGAGVTLVGPGVRFSNAGTVEVRSGTLDLEGPFANYNAATHTLSGGTYNVVGTLKLAGAAITVNAAALVLDGSASAVVDATGADALAGLADNAVGAGFTLRNGRTFRTAAALTNEGTMLLELGATLFLGGTLTTTGTFNWVGGRLQGPGLFDVGPRGALNLSGNEDKYLTNGGGLRIEGTAAWAGTGHLWLADGGSLTILAGATWDNRDDGMVGLTGAGAATITNQGTFGKSAGTAATVVGAGVRFSNAGTVQVLTGTLDLEGAFTNFDDGTRTLTGGSYLLAGTLKFPGAAVATNAATLVLDGTASAVVDQTGHDALAGLSLNDRGGSLTLRNGRSFRTAAALANAGTLTVELGATLGLGATLTDTGTVSWTGGHLAGPGLLDVAAGGSLALAGGDDKALDPGTAVRVAGTATWAGAGAFVLGDGSSLTVAAGGLFDAQDNGTVRVSGTGAGITNQGTFRKSAGAGVTLVAAGVRFGNNGTVEIRTGTLDLEGTFTNFDAASNTLTDGTYLLTGVLTFPGAKIRTNAAALVLNGAGAGIVDQNRTDALAFLTAIAPAGSLTVANGATLSPLGQVVSDGVVTLAPGGTLYLGDTFRSKGSFTWTGGILGGLGDLRVDGTIDLTGSDPLQVSNVGGLEVYGRATWTAMSSRIWLSKGSDVTVMAGGMFDARGDGEIDMGSADPGSGFIVNYGTFRKSAGTGTTVIASGVGFWNLGTVEVATGTLDLEGTFRNFDDQSDTLAGGTYVLNGTLQFPNAKLKTNAAALVLDGPDSAVIDATGQDALAFLAANASGASLTVADGRILSTFGPVVNDGVVTLGPGGTLDLGDTFLSRGGFTWTGGRLTGLGDLYIDSTGTLDLTGSDPLEVDNVGGIGIHGRATWTGTGRLWVSKGSDVTVMAGGVFDARGDGDIEIGSAGPGNGFVVNYGTFRKSAGTGAVMLGPGVGFQNQGTVEVLAGTLDLEGTFANFDAATQTLTDGTYILTSILQFPGAAIRTNAAAVVLRGPDAAIADTDGNDALVNLTRNAAGASLALLNGATVTTGKGFVNAGTVRIGADSTFLTTADYTQEDGRTILIAGTLAAATVAIDGGILDGVGTIDGDVWNAGVLEVGGAGVTGVLDIEGNFTQTAAGVLNLELGGPDLGYDQLHLSGTAGLDGTLNVTLLDGFFARAGDSFQVLTFGSRSGDFAQMNLPHLGHHLTFDPYYDDGSLTLFTRRDWEMTGTL